MNALQITHAGALGAGFLSFVSPCVLPLVPAYLCFLGGASLDELIHEDGVERALARRVWYSALAFVLGFASVFMGLGAAAGMVNGMLARHLDVLSQIAGVVIVVFGLHFAGLFRIGMLDFEKRYHLEDAPTGVVGSYVMGLAFAFGWTPCVGPILATILMVAAGGETAWYGTSLLGAYALGLGIPFLLAAAALGPFMKFFARFRRHMQKVETVIGILLVTVGISFLTGSVAEVAGWLVRTFPFLGRIG